MSRVERNQYLYNEENPVTVQRSRGPSLGGILVSLLGYVTMVVVAFACLSLVVPRILGYEAYVVVSGSMEPNIPVRSIVLAKETDPAQLQTGDVIVFVDPARGTTPITHRVVENDTAAGAITTKGDANEREDVNPVTYDNVIGKVDAHIPHMGYVAATLTSFLGKLVAVFLLIEAWLLIEIGRRIRRRR